MTEESPEPDASSRRGLLRAAGVGLAGALVAAGCGKQSLRAQVHNSAPVLNTDAIVWTRKLLDDEGVFAGVSSGAIASIAVRIAGELDEGNVVFVVADDGWKYLSSGIYTLPVD